MWGTEFAEEGTHEFQKPPTLVALKPHQLVRQHRVAGQPLTGPFSQTMSVYS